MIVPGDTIINIPAQGLGQQPYVIQLPARPQDWTDLGVYAPAIPGVIVALFGLWVAHRLTAKRERRRELLELTSGLKEALSVAEEECRAAWISDAGPERLRAVHAAKSSLHLVGIQATNLKKRTAQGLYGSLCHLFGDRPMNVDIIADIAELRESATGDPFEDPARPGDVARMDDISALVRSTHAKVDHHFFRLYG